MVRQGRQKAFSDRAFWRRRPEALHSWVWYCKRPLRVFYLQAEFNAIISRERIATLALTEAATLFLHSNFIVTPQNFDLPEWKLALERL